MAQVSYGCGAVENVIDLGPRQNLWLATLQAATYRRFGQGLGYFLTVANEVPKSGEVESISHWLHPSTPVRFQYDVRDPDADAAVHAIQLDWGKVEAAETDMDGPLGVTWNYFFDTSPEVNIPFNPDERA